MRTPAIVVLVAALAGMGSCASHPARGPYAPMWESDRSTTRAEKLNRDATAVIDTDPGKAESLLREALTADLYYGQAHNNLGVVYLKQGRLYEAAGEFEWARKLMPGAADPRMNLALTLERAGRTDEALSAYAEALEADPAHIQSVQALARLQLKAGRPDRQTPAHLAEIATRGTTEHWREWAREREEMSGPSAGPIQNPRIEGENQP